MSHLIQIYIVSQLVYFIDGWIDNLYLGIAAILKNYFNQVAASLL